MTTEEMILSDDYIQNRNLWRRWTLIQIYRTIQSAEHASKREAAFQQAFFDNRQASYLWQSTLREINTLSQLKGKARRQRERFFSFDTILGMLDEYSRLPMTSDLSEKLESMVQQAKTAKEEQSYEKLAVCINQFMQTCLPHFDKNYKPNTWKWVFQMNGAYHTMDNLIKFHQCRMQKPDKTFCDSRESLSKLETLTDTCTKSRTKASAHKMFQAMLQLMDDNRFDITKTGGQE